MPCNCAKSFNSGGQARSMHSGGVNVGFGDGSVRFIKNSVTNKIWWAILTSNDGYILGSDQY
jgi:prepilin-type processing-associated H-X9-DG protein